MIITVFGIISPLIAASLCLFVPISWWWCAPIALGVFTMLNVWLVLSKYVQSLFLKKEVGGKPSAYCRFWVIRVVEWFNTLAGVSVKLEGEENIPDEPCLLICNHRSLFDATVALAALRRRKMSVIAKESVFRLPIVGPFIRRSACLPLDRGNPRKGLATLKNASKLITEYGMDVLIYPEGTRSPDTELLPFKEGAFMVAKWAKAPIVVLKIEGTERIKGRSPLRKTRVTLRVVGVIDKPCVEETRVTPLSDKARDIMLNS